MSKASVVQVNIEHPWMDMMYVPADCPEDVIDNNLGRSRYASTETRNVYATVQLLLWLSKVHHPSLPGPATRSTILSVSRSCVFSRSAMQPVFTVSRNEEFHTSWILALIYTMQCFSQSSKQRGRKDWKDNHIKGSNTFQWPHQRKLGPDRGGQHPYPSFGGATDCELLSLFIIISAKFNKEWV